MARDDTTEQVFPSTTWRWKHVMLRGPRPPQDTQRSAAAPPSPLRSRDPRSPLQIVVRYSGGSEAWWVVEARGRSWRVPGDRALHDVLAMVNRTS